MKKSRKHIGAALVFTLAATLLAPIGISKVSAGGFTPVAFYDFENGTGMNSSGIACTAPTVITDSQRGNVLKFFNGSGTTTVTQSQDPTLADKNDWYLKEGSPSSLKFKNPFKGKNLTGATISYWIKIPNEKAGGVINGDVDNTAGIASGILGFVDSEARLVQHPDCENGGHSDLWWQGRTFFGINAQPCAYFSQIHHNSIVAMDMDATLSYKTDQWQYISVSVTNETIKIYLNGQPLKQTEVTKGKRFYGSEDYENPGNEGMPFLLDFLCDNMSYTFGGKAGTSTFIDKNSGATVTYGKIPSNVQCYVGFTGFSPTYSGVCIDDLAFFTKAYNDSDMKALYEAAKSGTLSTGSTLTSSGTGSSVSSGSPSASTSAVSQEVAAVLTASTKLVSAPEGVSIGTPIAILKNDATLGSTYDTVKTFLDTGIASIIAKNTDWSGLTLSKNIYIQEIPATGRSLSSGEKAIIEMDIPAGFDTNMLWVLRVDPDGTVTKCNISSIADGKLQFETDRIAKFALVEMKLPDSDLPKTGAVDNGFFLLTGLTLLAGGFLLISRKKSPV